MNETTELTCPCGHSLLPGSLATEELVDAWLAEHAGHTVPEANAKTDQTDVHLGICSKGVGPVAECHICTPAKLAEPTRLAEPAKLDLEEMCRREGYAARAYRDNAVIFTDDVDALICARALRKKGFKVMASGYVLEVLP